MTAADVQGAKRKLVAVLAADVVGYSRMMGRDEEGTLAQLQTTRRSVINRLVESHDGRVVKTTGDGFLMEFGSVITAFRFAADLQEAMSKANREKPDDARLVFRIGINVADVIVDEDDLYGDGVNIAARLEQVCPPGGVCVSERAWRDLRQLDIPFIDLGELRMKNIAEPVRAFAVEPSSGVSASARRRRPYTANLVANRPRRWMAPALLGGLFLVGMTGYVALGGAPASSAELQIAGVETHPPDAVTAQALRSELIDVFGEDQRVSLRMNDNIRAAGRSFVLQSNVRRSGADVRFNFLLTNATTGAHVAAYNVVRPSQEAEALPEQAAILAKTAIGCLLIGASMHPEPLPDRVLALYAQVCEDSLDESLGAGRMYGSAKAITSFAPDFAVGWSARANYAAGLALLQAGEMRRVLKQDAVASAARAEALNPNNSEIFLARERLLPRSRITEREVLLRKATSVELTYNGYEHLRYGDFLTELGRHSEAVREYQLAYDLNPIDPYAGSYLVQGLLRAKRVTEAKQLLSRLRRVWPSDPLLQRLATEEAASGIAG